jgi:hypothetical protein
MKKIACFFVCGLLAFSLRSVAQSNYESAIGIRAGIPVAASLKHFISGPGAIEVNAGFWHDPVSYGFTYFTIGAMYQYHFPINAVEGLKWYIGGGALAQFYSYNSSWGDNKPSSTAFGINAVGGLDYKFANIPLNLSADWTPTIFIARAYYNTFQPGYGGICARYTFR